MINLKNIKPNIRYLGDVKEVIYDKKWLETASGNLELYYVYRDLAENENDKIKIIKKGLRYDNTIMPPLILGKEFNKTQGHSHPFVSNTDITYAEIYEVLEGQTIFLLQNSENNKVKDIFGIKAKKGDKVIIPPNHEHLIINPGNKDLRTCNWVCREFGANIYEPFQNKHGFSYYALKNNLIRWIKNKNYKLIPSLRFEKPNNFYNFDIPKDKPIYQLVDNLEKLDFLKNPQKYEWE